MNVTRLDGDQRVRAASGYDHDWFSWEPTPRRPAPRWPGGARLAVCVVLDLTVVEWEGTVAPTVPPPGGRGIGRPPDIPRMSHREFGHRVGVFRLLEMLRRHDMPVAVAVDVLTVQHYPSLLAHLRGSVTEFIAGGLSASRPITSEMGEDEERDYIELSLSSLADGLGVRPTGWTGPEHGESWRTPGLLAGAGIEYVTDWCNDDLPYAMPGAGSGLWACPLSWELSDLNAMFIREVGPDDYASSVSDAVTQLAEESTDGGRMLGLQLHPWLSGQAFRADAIESILTQLEEDVRVWRATPAEVVDLCRSA